MKVFIKLLAFLAILICFFCSIAFLMVRSAEEHVLSVQHELEAREGVVIDNIMELQRSKMHSFAWDYSWWQDLIDWIDDPNEEWLEDQFDQVLYTFDVGFFAVYDASGARLSSVYDRDLNDAGVELPDQLSVEVLERPQSVLYEASFERRPEGLLELYYAPVLPQEDVERSGRHYGYLVVGRFWDDAYLETLESVTGAEMTLLAEPAVNVSSNDDEWTGTIQLERLLYDYKGELQGALMLTKFLPVSKRIVDEQGKAFGFLLTATMVAVLSVVLFVLFVVTRPLHYLSAAMESGNVKELSRYGNRHSEFKHLAELIVQNYEQQERLELEIARRRETEDALTRSRDSAECASRAKSQFLANMSHETRTPLHTISGYAALLEESELTDDQKQSLEFIRSSSDRLVQMLTDIIELSSMEAEEMHPQKSWFVLSELFDELIGAGVNSFRDGSVSVHSEYGGECPSQINSDYERLRELLLNLVDNAVKFTHSGTVTIRCNCIDADERFRVCIEIEDSGIGIPKKELDHIFDAFYLVDDSDSRQYQGGGLGLAIAKGLSDILSAQIEAESIPGEGSTFRLILMLEPEDVRFETEQVPSSGLES